MSAVQLGFGHNSYYDVRNNGYPIFYMRYRKMHIQIFYRAYSMAILSMEKRPVFVYNEGI